MKIKAPTQARQIQPHRGRLKKNTCKEKKTSLQLIWKSGRGPHLLSNLIALAPLSLGMIFKARVIPVIPINFMHKQTLKKKKAGVQVNL